MTTNVLIATTHVSSNQRIRIEAYNPQLPEAERVYRVITELATNQCSMDYSACLHGHQALRLTEVEAPTEPPAE